MSDVLQKICDDKHDHVAQKKTERPVEDLLEAIKNTLVPRGFINALKNNKQNKPDDNIALIAEVKKASPSKGVIRANFDPVDIAKIYQNNGASCLSVLTDEPYFQGHDDYFTAIRDAVSLPMLRKDFMVDEYQIYESRTLGADCILLIMACLDDAQVKDFYDLATSLGMDALFEVHDEIEMERALKLNPKMLGVNNRNLKTLDVDLKTGLNLATQIPTGILKVAESGIYTSDDVTTFLESGFDAFLIGESLMREDDIAAAVQKIISTR